jgi:hypothetical protein
MELIETFPPKLQYDTKWLEYITLQLIYHIRCFHACSVVVS